MPTQIVDNFQLNVAKPIDSRMVTSGTASRNALQFKYEGLRVYDLINKASYVYIDGAWQQESSSGGGGGSVTAGTTNRVLKYATATTIGDSAIVDRGTYTSPNIGIGKNPTVNIALDVNGRINATTLNVSTTITATNFVGELNGSYISVKSLGVDKITAGSDNQVLKTIGTGNSATVAWVNDNNTTISISNETANTGTHYLLFSDSSSVSGTLKINNGTTRLIGVKPSTSQILASGDTNNSSSAPGYAFSGTTTAGLYGNATEIGLSFNSKALLKLNTTNLSILDITGTTVLSSGTGLVNFGSGALIKSQATSAVATPDYTWQGDVTTGMYKPASQQIGFSTNGVSRVIISNTSTTISTPATLSSTLSVTDTSTFTGLATFGGVTVGGTFKLTSGTPGVNKVLTSDTSGNGTWQAPPQDTPYGTVIMWLSTTIPTGWRQCKEYTSGSGFTQIRYNGWVYTQGSYVQVPIIDDKVIMGGPSVLSGGDTSPKVAHTSGAKITRNSSGVYNYTKITTSTGNAAKNYQYKGSLYLGEEEMSTGEPYTWASVLQGEPNNGGMLFTNTGITKYQQLIFIVKINESASANQEGHWKLIDNSAFQGDQGPVDTGFDFGFF